MKLNKKIFGIFLSLSMVFVFSFCVRAQDQAREEAKQRVEQFIAKTGFMSEELKGYLTTKEKFEEDKKSVLEALEKNKEQKVEFAKKVDELFKGLKEVSTAESIKGVIALTIEQYKKTLLNVQNSLKIENLEKEKIDELKACETRLMSILNYLEALKGKDNFNDEEKKGILNLESSVKGLVKELLDSSETHLEAFKNLNYEDVKIWQEG